MLIDIKNLIFEVKTRGLQQIPATEDKKSMSAKQDSDTCYVEWRVQAPNEWQVERIKEKLNQFKTLLQGCFQLEFVYVGSLVMETSVPRHILTDNTLLTPAVRSFLENFVEVCEIDTDTVANVFIDLSVVQSLRKDSKPKCQPCGYRNVIIDASHYCKDCVEMYCTKCTSLHRTTKRFAKDEIVDLKDCIYTFICAPCEYRAKDVKASYRCEECDEFLCGNCKALHVSYKQFYNHKIKPASSALICDNCPDLNATSFCKECAIPICDECRENHKAMKMTRGHTFSKDLIGCFLSTSKTNVTKENTLTGAQVTTIVKSKLDCDPCRYQKNDAEATYFCYDCNEHLCNDCMKFHQNEKVYTAHKICPVLSSDIFCVTCKSLHQDVIATLICLDCEDKTPYCDICFRKHSSLKITRGHRCSNDLRSIRLSCYNQLQSEKENRNEKGLNETVKDKPEVDIGEKKTNTLGKPTSAEHKSDNILLKWSSVKTLEENEEFAIVFKEYPNGKWKQYVAEQQLKQTQILITGLKADTAYSFKVRVINSLTSKKGEFSDESDPIATRKSSALVLLSKSVKIENGPPSVYRLPIAEIAAARNRFSKTRKFILGKPGKAPKEKTIMIIGSTGSGKSTLINGMANYLMGVNFEDQFRLTLIHSESSEKERENNQAISQTEWVTCYTLQESVIERVDYTVNLIDTPGFGDARGLEQDEKILDQIRELFTQKGEKGVATLDAVCFLLRASDSRLTAAQRYLFESIVGIFGHDIKDNICTLITFAGGQKPPVLAGIEAIYDCFLPYEIYFTFNNSALYVDNTTDMSTSLLPFFWDMGTKSYQAFFSHLTELQTKSLTLTSEVLKSRQKLENTIINLQREIDICLTKINLLEKEILIFSQNKDAILANKDFEYEVDESFQEQIDLTGKSQYTTNCLICHYTCHEHCKLPDDNDKARCIAMNLDGKCTECPSECHWSEHKNTPYIIKWSTKKVTKRYDEMKKKYEEATQKQLTQEQVLEEMDKDIRNQESVIHIMMEVINQLNNRLKEIALRPDPLNIIQYIELMIASEEREKKSGFEGRIDALQKCKKRAQYGESVQVFQDHVRNTRKSMAVGDAADAIFKMEKDGTMMGKIKNLVFGKPKK